jgi:hypothetical protein
MTSASRTKAARNSKRFTSATYLSNFGRRSTSSSSKIVAVETNTLPLVSAKSNACRGTERGKIAALMATEVSMTTRRSLIFEQRIQDFRCHPVGFCICSDLIHDLAQGTDRTGRQLAQSQCKQQFQLAPLLSRCLSECPSCVRIDFNGDGGSRHIRILPRAARQQTGEFAETINDGFCGNGGLEQKSPSQTKLRIRLGR